MNIEGLVNTQRLHLKCIVGDEQLNQCVSQQVNLYHSYQFVTGITDEGPNQGSVCRDTLVWLPTHKGSDT